MAKSMAAALERAGIINPKQAKKQDGQERASCTSEERRRIKKQQLRLQDKHGVPVIADNEDFFQSK